MTKIKADFITGFSQEFLLADAENQNLLLHAEMLPSLHSLQEKARQQGFHMQIVSGYRDYHRQLRIWNEKVQGLRSVYDYTGLDLLDVSTLSEEELIFSILRWSALPGMSRHHWGTDIDVINQGALTGKYADYKIQLTPEEVAADGIFGDFHLWLDEVIEQGESFGFYRPYEEDLGGVSPEKWHLSYAPVARLLTQELSLEFFQQHLKNHGEILLQEKLLELSEEIYQRFIINIQK